jgi:hypothetical protein
MRAILRVLGSLALILSTPVAALLITRHIATAYAMVTMPLLPGSGGLYFPGSVEDGYGLSPSWATWSVIGWSIPLAMVGAAVWLWGWRRQSTTPLVGQRWLTVRTALVLFALICLGWSLSVQLNDIPRTDVFARVRV